ncbi:MAG TPA: hypothetical protein VED40_17385 [Azospirillaceae bacterium]|nr:hypothetical protein [Azospirillaceae bacterium]
MGVVIGRAEVAGDAVAAADYLLGMAPPRCPIPGCGIRLAHRPAGMLPVGEGALPVPASYLRRLGSLEHAADCPHNPGYLAARLARFAGGDEPLLEAPGERCLLLHLDRLGEAMRVARLMGRDMPASLRRRLRTARAVLALAARLQNRAELSDLVRLADGEWAPGWDKLLHGMADYQRLYRRMLQGPPSHPLAVTLACDAIFEPGALGDRAVARCVAVAGTRRGHPVLIQPWIRFDDPSCAHRFAANRLSLAFATPLLVDPGPAARTGEEGEPPKARLILDVAGAWQFCRVPPRLGDGLAAPG